jgi:hypothetical protein
MQYLIYVIPVVIVAIIVITGYLNAKRKVQQYQNNGSTEAKTAPALSNIYEKPGVNQQSNHPLGAVQSVIYGRIRFMWVGTVVIGVALFGLYAVYSGKLEKDIMDNFGGRTPLHILIVTVLMVGALVWGLRIMSYATYRIRLRRTGFEISSILGKNTYEYKDVYFYLEHTIQHKYDSERYEPVFMKAGNYHFIWVCQVLFRDGRPPVLLKSSRYAWLKNRIQNMMAAMEIK